MNLFGTNKLATIEPATMALTEIALPRADSLNLAVAAGVMLFEVQRRAR